MVRERKSGLMEHIMKEIMFTQKRKDLGSFSGTMVQLMRGSSRAIILRGLALTPGAMEGNTMVLG